jgi:hypothetical protein
MYRPNFCCECGERILRERWRIWTSRRYCGNCVKKFQKKQIVGPVLIGAALLGGGLLTGRLMRPERPAIIERGALVTLTSTPKTGNQNSNQQTNVNATSQNQNTANINAEPFQNPLELQQPYYYCGARTQKGTPCMRRVRGPVRCWQHERKQAMMPQEKLLAREE